jgi:hypothetical protein
MSKFPKENVACTSSHPNSHEVVPRKKMTFYPTHVIMTKFGTIITLFERLFLFFAHDMKNVIFSHLREHINMRENSVEYFP